MYVYKWGPDYVVARSAADVALALMQSTGIGEGDLEEQFEEEPRRLDDDETVKITIDRDMMPNPMPKGFLEVQDKYSMRITAPASEWARVSKRGSLCSEEW